MRAAAYLRVSTDEQASHGVSLEAQRAMVEAYAGLYGLELVAVVEDAGVSAKTLERPWPATACWRCCAVATSRRSWWRSWTG